MTTTGTRLRAYKNTQAMLNDMDYFDNLIVEWGLALNLDNFWLDTFTNKKIHKNHLKSMLRRAYLSENRPLQGKALDVMLNGYLRAKFEAADHFYRQNPKHEMFVEIKEAAEEYI